MLRYMRQASRAKPRRVFSDQARRTFLSQGTTKAPSPDEAFYFQISIIALFPAVGVPLFFRCRLFPCSAGSSQCFHHCSGRIFYGLLLFPEVQSVFPAGIFSIYPILMKNRSYTSLGDASSSDGFGMRFIPFSFILCSRNPPG